MTKRQRVQTASPKRKAATAKRAPRSSRGKEDAAVFAAMELVKRCGGAPSPELQLDFEVGFLRRGVPPEEAGWFCAATRNGVQVLAEEHASAAAAADALVAKLIDGSRCLHCGRPITTSLRDGLDAENCYWRRLSTRWMWGCGLAAVLSEEDLN